MLKQRFQKLGGGKRPEEEEMGVEGMKAEFVQADHEEEWKDGVVVMPPVAARGHRSTSGGSRESTRSRRSQSARSLARASLERASSLRMGLERRSPRYQDPSPHGSAYASFSSIGRSASPMLDPDVWATGYAPETAQVI
mmetsp:Transcript_10527/g.24939  ORF Transcript_10527/g.24939 Transcript_10527/m.24939 type:complete len:139 (-) Transcript_10527:160-576(-)